MKVTAKMKIWLPKLGLGFEAGETKTITDKAAQERIKGDPNFIVEEKPTAMKSTKGQPLAENKNKQ